MSPAVANAQPLAGVRIVECSMLGPAAITTALADLGAEVIKVEPPTGDYVRRMTWPIVEGVSLMHLHVNRGKRSIAIDLKSAEGMALFEELVAASDVVVEAMRPGGLARRGLGYDRLQELNPRIVFCTISGYGATGPYRTSRATASPTTHGRESSSPRSTTRATRRSLTTCRSGSTPVRSSARSASSPA